MATTCGSENIYSVYTFGLYPSTGVLWYGLNSWTGSTSTSYSLRKMPASYTAVSFYTVTAGDNDQIHCSTLQGWVDCPNGALFNTGTNVKAQLDVGAGSTASQFDYNFSDWSIYNLGGGDSDGVGHFRSKNNTGEIQWQMLNSTCTGIGCKGTYTGTTVAK
jgi:hypothetical protein